MIVIKDAVHGEITLTELEAELIDSPEMQRLRRVKQLAATNLIYPGANHSRFEHCLGTMHLAGKISEKNKLAKEEKQAIRAAALLHDVGHSAFSHDIEETITSLTGKTHEQTGRMKIEAGELKRIIEENGCSAKEIAQTLQGKGFADVISSQIGADRMDYLQRDAHYTGVAYGVIDEGRLIQTMNLNRKKIVLEEGALEAAESLLIARFLMFSAVYLHHTVRIVSSMLRKAVESAIEDGTIQATEAHELDDAQMSEKLKQNKQAKELVERIEERKLYKRATEFEFEKLLEEGKKTMENPEKRRKLELEISEQSECNALLDYSKGYWTSGGTKTRIMKNGKQMELEQASEIIRSLETAEQKRLTVIIASPKEKTEKTRKQAERILASLIQ
ncbi:HD domain-containing protein [Candidatus Micrarchaeota archaeon]|nr:HD domain-containing protein [Candidatus Micrarchaeota archaeon]